MTASGVPLGAGGRVVPRPNVVWRRMPEDGSVLLDLDAGHYFVLDEVGSVVWELLARTADLDEVHREMTRRYEAPPERLWTDLVALVGELAERRLVEWSRG